MMPRFHSIREDGVIRAPKAREAVFKLYRIFDVQRITGKPFCWFFLFANAPDTDPELNPLWGQIIENNITTTLQPNVAQLDFLPLPRIPQS